METDIVELLFNYKPDGFLLHRTTAEAWEKIQKEGLVPQLNLRENIYQKRVGSLPERITWLDREPAEVHLNRENHPVVIAVGHKQSYNMIETIPGAEYITPEIIHPSEFLGVFDWRRRPEKDFLDWLGEIEEVARKRQMER